MYIYTLKYPRHMVLWFQRPQSLIALPGQLCQNDVGIMELVLIRIISGWIFRVWGAASGISARNKVSMFDSCSKVSIFSRKCFACSSDMYRLWSSKKLKISASHTLDINTGTHVRYIYSCTAWYTYSGHVAMHHTYACT